MSQTIRLIANLTAVVLGTLSIAMGSDFASAPATGAAIVTHEQFTNVYLYRNPDQQTWDENLRSGRLRLQRLDGDKSVHSGKTLPKETCSELPVNYWG